MTIDEKQNTVKRSNLYNKLYNIINQIPRKQVDCDASCPHSCAIEIEQIIHEALKKQREICAEVYEDFNEDVPENGIKIINKIENAPEPEIGE